MTAKRLGSQPQSVPMPRNFPTDSLPHPEIIRNVDGRTLQDRNVCEPFGPGSDDGYDDGDEMQTEY